MGLFSRKKADTIATETNEDTAAAAENEGAEAASDAPGDELIAVIAAAIAAYEAEQFRQTLYIQKVNRACGIRPAWGAMGTQEAIDTRRM